jgi:hypothetical protein
MKILPKGAELFLADERDEANSLFAPIHEGSYKHSKAEVRI